MPDSRHRPSQTPPSSVSSRNTRDSHPSNGRYASPRNSQPPERSERPAISRTSSVASHDTKYDPRDRFYLYRDDDDGDDDDDMSDASPTGRTASSYSQPARSRRHSPSATARTPSPPWPPRRPPAGEDGWRYDRTVDDQNRPHRDHGPRSERLGESQYRKRDSPYPPQSKHTSRSPSPPRYRPRRSNPSNSTKSSPRHPPPNRHKPQPKSKSKSTTHRPLPPRRKHTALSLAQEAAQHALDAGAMAALRLRDDPSPWRTGAKGGQIAAAAISAVVVDTFLAKRVPMRKGGFRHSVAKQAAQVVIKGLVANVGGSGSGGGAGGGVGRRRRK